MKMQTLIGAAAALGLALSTGVAAAQTVVQSNGPVSINSTAVATVSPGSSQTIGTFTVSNSGTVTAALTRADISIIGGGMSNCQLYNIAGVPLNIALSPTGTSTNFQFSPVLSVAQGTSSFTIRCDVMGGGGPVTVPPGIPNTGAPGGFTLRTSVAPSVPQGAQNVTLANISLDASGLSGLTTIPNIPIMVTAGNGASTADLVACYLANAVSGLALTPPYSLGNGAATGFTFANGYPAIGGAASMLALRCSVAPATPIGGTFTISVDPTMVTGTNGSVTIQGGNPMGTGPNGLPAATSGTVIVTGPGTIGGSVGMPVPGVPNTGAGGMAAFYALVLLLTGALALAMAKRARA